MDELSNGIQLHAQYNMASVKPEVFRLSDVVQLLFYSLVPQRSGRESFIRIVDSGNLQAKHNVS